jgi:hypothetical protein
MRNLTGESTILLDRQLTGPWDAFVEYAGEGFSCRCSFSYPDCRRDLG